MHRLAIFAVPAKIWRLVERSAPAKASFNSPFTKVFHTVGELTEVTELAIAFQKVLAYVSFVLCFVLEGNERLGLVRYMALIWDEAHNFSGQAETWHTLEFRLRILVILVLVREGHGILFRTL